MGRNGLNEMDSRVPYQDDFGNVFPPVLVLCRPLHLELGNLCGQPAPKLFHTLRQLAPSLKSRIDKRMDLRRRSKGSRKGMSKPFWVVQECLVVAWRGP